MKAALAWIGLGANLGDPVRQLADAMSALSQLPGTAVLARSALYQTAAMGAQDGPQPDYVNAVAQLSTTLEPLALMQALLQIETSAGRRRDGTLNAPRMLDLDLLAYDALLLDQPGLRLPHPRLHQRAFVLAPLLELGANFEIEGLPLSEHWKAVSMQRVLRLPTPAVWRK